MAPYQKKSTTLPAAQKIDPRQAAAVARGEVVRLELATYEGGSISTLQAARLLGVSPATVLRWWRRHKLIGWKHGRLLRVPVWQFAEGKVVNGIEQVLPVLDSNDQWRVMLYFLSNGPSLSGRRPLDLLREGKTSEVIAHAKAFYAENTW